MRTKLKQAVYVLSRMSTAVFMLAVLALASVAGTVFLQNQPVEDYRNTFGNFWAEVFMQMGLHQVYIAPWYLLILLVVLVSVMACIITNGPRFIKLWRKPKRVASAAMLRQWPVQQTLTKTQAIALQKKLLAHGFRCKLDSSHGHFYTRTPYSRAGYFLSHIGVIVLAIGGLLTGFMGFRGTLHLPAGEGLNAVWVQVTDGGYARNLPFTIRNDGFAITTYPDGTAKSFTTRLTLLAEGEQPVTRDLAVNAPVRFHNHSIYQSSFGDAGSKVELTVLNLNSAQRRTLTTAVHQQTPLGDATLSIDDARMHESRQIELPGTTGIIMRDVGPSIDIMLKWPDRMPHVLRLYLNHPDILGVAESMTAEGAPIFATVPLGLSVANAHDWDLFFAVKSYLSKHPNLSLNEALIKVSAPIVHNMAPAERVAYVARTLQALTISQNLDLRWLPTLQKLEPAYYTALQVSYDPGFWWFIIGSMMLIAGVFLMVYADHWRVWFVPQKDKVLMAAHASRRHDMLQEFLGGASH